MEPICAWCRKEGKLEMGSQPKATLHEPESHGICPRHLLSLRHYYWREILKKQLNRSAESSYK